MIDRFAKIIVEVKKILRAPINNFLGKKPIDYKMAAWEEMG